MVGGDTRPSDHFESDATQRVVSNADDNFEKTFLMVASRRRHEFNS